MKKLRELTTRYSLADLVEAMAAHVADGETCPEAKPEGEREFVKLHKTAKYTDPDVYGNPSFSGKVKKDTSKAGKEPLPGFPPEVKKESLEEQGTHALQKGENPWKVWKSTRGESGLSWGDFKSAQTDKKVVGNRSSRRLQPGQEIQTGVKAAEKPAESPKAPEYPKTEVDRGVKVQTPDTHGATGAPQPSKSPTAPQWSPTARPFNMTPVTPEMKAKQIQSPINKEPMNRIPGTTPPPSAMDRVKAVTGRATPAATTGSASAGTQAKGETSAAPSGPSASGSVNLRNATRAAGAVGQAFTGGGAAVGQAIGKSVAPVVQPAAKAAGQAGQIIGGGGASIGQRLGQKFRNWLGKEETDELMNRRAAIMSSLIRGLEPELGEAAGIAKMIAPKVNPLIKRPKFDEKGNVVLTKDAKANITQGKKSRKLTGQTYSPSKQKRFGEAKEIEEAKDEYRHSKARQTSKDPKGTVLVSPKGYTGGGKVSRIPKSQYNPKKHSLAEEQLDEKNWFHKVGASTPNDEKKKKEPTVLVSPKGYKGGGKVSRIPKSQYDPKKHSLAEEQLDEKNWIQNAIKKPGALTAAAHRAKKSVGEFAREHKHSSGKVGKRARLALTLKGLNKEETQLDELKKETLVNYVKTATASTAFDSPKDAKKRREGIYRAADRLGGSYKSGKPLKFKIPGDESNKTYSQQKKKIYHAEETEIDEGLRPKIKVSGDRSVDKDVQVGKKTYHVSGFKSTKTAEDEAKKGWEKTASKVGKWRAKTFGTKFVHEETGLDEVITKSTPAGDVIHDFVHSSNKVFKGDSKKQRIKRALGAYYGKQRGE